MMAFVVDCSVAMAWCFEDQASPYTEAVLDRLRDTQAVVPAIWPLEVVNVLLLAERRQRLTEAQTLRFVELLRALPITVDGEALFASLGPVLALGRQHGLSAYDATYLELAARHGLSLATQDEELARAATRMGVPRVS